MRKTIYILIAGIFAAAATAQAQSLSDLERVQRRVQLLPACEELVKSGGKDDVCKDVVPVRQQSVQASESRTSSTGGGSSAAGSIEVTAYRALPVAAGYMREIEAAFDGQIYRLQVGGEAMGWRLTRLTDYEAEFRPVGKKKGKARVIAFRSQAAPAPEQVATPGLVGSSAGGPNGAMYVPAIAPARNSAPPPPSGPVPPPSVPAPNPAAPPLR